MIRKNSNKKTIQKAPILKYEDGVGNTDDLVEPILKISKFI
jgi:hypothetical protein